MTRLKKNHQCISEQGPETKGASAFRPSERTYQKFKKINGKHPLQDQTINSHILYNVRSRKKARTVVFNFALAKEMGLIPESHPEILTKELEQKFIETFALVIINEYDEINNIEFPKETIRANKYMATRYLQLQHPNKTGKTSGDGRSIWNGVFRGKGKSWDISSCGTGATSLSPATHIQKKFFQTGDPSISYGCGYAEVDEGLATLFFSEVLQKNQITTERVLGILKFDDGFAVTVRVHENLIRPSHMFNHLKQSNYEALKAMVDYYIDRQVENGSWCDVPKSSNKRYDYFLDKQTEVFANVAAKFEDEYIFCWLDWDGDNILMDGGIIDYGSVRQFGLYHSEYRFDDDDRFSTSIPEQKSKAKYTVQCFAQIVDFLKNKKRSPISQFAQTKWAKNYETIFTRAKHLNLLRKVGFKSEASELLLKRHPKLVKSFLENFSYFERAKSEKGLKKVNDGITWDAIFCMRDILRELPQLLLSRGESIEREEFIEILRSSYATEKDLELSSYRKKKIDAFQRDYWRLLESASNLQSISVNAVLLDVTMRSSVINKYDRVTGDSITTIVNMLMENLPKMPPEKIYKLLHHFSEYQNLDPDYEKSLDKSQLHQSKLMRGFLKVVREYREGL
jgi:uncharacterized protein YdiU (UPF0061 family)